MTKDLTEQWKRGELKSGWYFVKVGKYEAEIDLYDDDQNQWFNRCDKDIYPVEILAPVPSYDHFVELTEKDKENQKLKELLKECRDVAEFTKTIVNKHKWLNEVITKIDEVLK